MKTLLLTDQQIIMLDGCGDAKIQATVDAAKLRIDASQALTHLTPAHAGFIADAVAHAQKNGMLKFRILQIDLCSLCGRRADYHKYTRSSRMHQRGDKDYNKPILFSGFELDSGYAHIKNHAMLGGCSDCYKALHEDLKAALCDVKAEIPKVITGIEPRFKRYDNKECGVCGWAGHEGQMGLRSTVMGNGYYPATCPKCGATNMLFDTKIKTVNGFTLVETCSKWEGDSQ